jgi:hypothetical protein
VSEGSYKVQINVKVGDHLINIQGDSGEEAISLLEGLASQSRHIHSAIEHLDGRPATEVVQKETTWGARSKGGRTYPRAVNTAASTTPTPIATAQSVQDQAPSATELLQNELGAKVVSSTSTPSDASTRPEHVPNSNPELCADHGLKRKFYPAGKNKNTNKDFSASWRCPAAGCKPLWDKGDGRFE